MSMLSAQADELRVLADKLRSVRLDDRVNCTESVETMFRATGAMREAADTIISLRDRLQAATLGSEREQRLEGVLRDWIACDPRCTNRSCGDCEHDEDEGCGLYRRMCELGVISR